MRGGPSCFAFASVIGAIAASGAACDSFEEADGAANDGGTTDAPSLDTAVDDAPSGAACEVLTGQHFTTAEAPVTGLAADNAHVYWASAQGTTRQSVGGDTAEPVFRNLGVCTDVVLSADHIAARFVGGSIRQLQKAALTGDAGIPSASNSTTVGLDPRNSNGFFVRRSESTFACNVNLGCSKFVEQNNVSNIVPAPLGYDYMAPSAALAGVYHCEADCAQTDSGTLLATASTSSTKIANDTMFVYFLDRAAGALRKVPRAGGATPSNVITGLVEPTGFAVDGVGRFVVATLANGVFRGPPNGCVAPKTQAEAGTTGGFALYGSNVWYTRDAEIWRFAE